IVGLAAAPEIRPPARWSRLALSLPRWEQAPNNGGTAMCYWFERGGDYIQCEVRRAGDHYELHVINSDGTESVEQFVESCSLFGRQVGLEERLLHDGWKGPHGRGI